MSSMLKKGITMIELIIVVSIIVILISITLPRFSEMRSIEVLKTATADVLSSVEKAHSESISSVDSSEYGVHFETNNVIIFKGTAYTISAADNETIPVISPATISSISLTGGVVDIYFDRLTGASSATGTVTVSNGSNSKILTISTAGSISSN